MPAVDRKLTTILSADVQGYSRLMEADEEGTFATLKSYRDAMARLIASHGGRVVNTWGDGLIAEFPSVVAAVRSAVDVQNELAQRNASRGEGADMYFRIGINLGDVIADGDDIYGDGVNIAARLQAEAPPGGILISRTVHDQVRNKLSVGFEFRGDLAVKNIDEKIPSYVVRLGAADSEPRVASQPSPPSAPSDLGADIAIGRFRVDRKIAVLAAVGAGLIVVNLATSPETFWARWPLLGFAVSIGLGWAQRTTRVDRLFAWAGVAALAIVAINLFTWRGTFWAIWPLIPLALIVVLRWISRASSSGPG